MAAVLACWSMHVLTLLLLLLLAGVDAQQQMNVFGEPIVPCSGPKGMQAGSSASGACTFRAGDAGAHQVSDDGRWSHSEGRCWVGRGSGNLPGGSGLVSWCGARGVRMSCRLEPGGSAEVLRGFE